MTKEYMELLTKGTHCLFIPILFEPKNNLVKILKSIRSPIQKHTNFQTMSKTLPKFQNDGANPLRSWAHKIPTA